MCERTCTARARYFASECTRFLFRISNLSSWPCDRADDFLHARCVSRSYNAHSNTHQCANAHFGAYGFTVGIARFGEAKRTFTCDCILARTATHALDLVHTRIARITHVRFRRRTHVVALQHYFCASFPHRCRQYATRRRQVNCQRSIYFELKRLLQFKTQAKKVCWTIVKFHYLAMLRSSLLSSPRRVVRRKNKRKRVAPTILTFSSCVTMYFAGHSQMPPTHSLSPPHGCPVKHDSPT